MITTPGNIIEYIERPDDEKELVVTETQKESKLPQAAEDMIPLRAAMKEHEKRYILSVLNACHGNVTKAASVLQIHRTGLYKKLREYQK